MKNLYLLFVLGALILTSSCNTNETYQLKYIYDYEKILSNDEKLQLDKLIVAHEQKTGNEIVLVTTANYEDEGDIEVFTLSFQSTHLVGKPDKDNGVLIVFSGKNSEVRITPGKGLAKMDEDGVTKDIIDNVMLPEFKKEEDFQGLLKGCRQIIEYLEKEK